MTHFNFGVFVMPLAHAFKHRTWTGSVRDRRHSHRPTVKSQFVVPHAQA